MRKLVAQPTKQTFLYVFDRVTGEPIWPINETAVPPGDVPGEWYCADAADSQQAAGLRTARACGSPTS